MTISLRQLTTALTENRLVYRVVDLQDGIRTVVTERGGRLLGVFLDDDSPSLTWINPVFAASDTLAAFLAQAGWNMGGERIWIAPEIQFNVQNRADFWNSLKLPPEVDPGGWAFESQGMAWTQTITLMAYNLASGQTTLNVRQNLRTVPNPLRALSNAADLMRGVRYGGYDHTVALRQLDDAPILSEAWNLVQLHAGGVLIIPTTGTVEVNSFFDPPPPDATTLDGAHLRIRITGDYQYKTGYKAATLTGRFGYYHALDGGQAYLLVRQFPNNPSSIYAEEPPFSPGVNGNSVHVYNDGGQFGGFGEMECSGQTIGGAAGQRESVDSFLLWVYSGAAEQVRQIARVLLGALP